MASNNNQNVIIRNEDKLIEFNPKIITTNTIVTTEDSSSSLQYTSEQILGGLIIRNNTNESMVDTLVTDFDLLVEALGGSEHVIIGQSFIFYIFNIGFDDDDASSPITLRFPLDGVLKNFTLNQLSSVKVLVVKTGHIKFEILETAVNEYIDGIKNEEDPLTNELIESLIKWMVDNKIE